LTFGIKCTDLFFQVRCFRKETGLEKKEERVSILTIVLFILGPLPQFIKLNACSGIPWTLTWAWAQMLGYVFTALTIICGRGHDEGYELLRAGTTLHDETKRYLKNTSDWIYGVAHVAQAAFSIWLLHAALYTQAVQVLVGKVFSLLFLTWVFVLFPLAVVLLGTWLLFNREPESRNEMFFRIFGGLSCLILGVFFSAVWIHTFVAEPATLAVFLEVRPDPFTVFSYIIWSVSIFAIAFLAFELFKYLSRQMGSNLEISLRHFPERQQSSEKSSGRTATFQLCFAVAMLSFAVAYYWQKYDPSDTVKPGWVDVFG
jgi:hypothetical protein